MFPVSVVRVTGTLDLPGAAAVRGFLFGCLAHHPVALVVDLSGLSGADDLPLAVLPEVARRAAEWPGAEVLLCAPHPHVVAALDRIGAIAHLRVYPDGREALAAAARRPPPLRLRRHMLPGVDAPRQARDVVTRAATAWRLPPDPAQVAQVIATELVSNAVRHAGTPLDFTVVLRDPLLDLAVGDGSPMPPRRRTIITEHDDHGRGLHLVEGLARSWGFVPTSAGKVVWATVPTG